MVPRILVKIYQKVYDGIYQKGGVVKYLFNKAVETKSQNFLTKGVLTHSFYDKVVFKKIKDIFGGRIELMTCGSAAIDPKIFLFFKIGLGINIVEGYAMTETSCCGTQIAKEDYTLGNCGGMQPYLKARIRDIPEMNYFSTDNPPRGELQLKGHCIFKGYFKNPEKTREAITEDGWLNTGDVVEVFPNGAIKIIDRAKNIFKLSQGEYVAPEKL